MPTVTTQTPTTSWNELTDLRGADFSPKRMDAASLAAYGELLAQTPLNYMDKISAVLGSPATQAEAADAVVRVRLSGPQAGITPTQAMSEADKASRDVYAGTSLLQVTHPDTMNVATRVAVLRGDASVVPEPSPFEVDLRSIMRALEQRDAPPAPRSIATPQSQGPS